MGDPGPDHRPTLLAELARQRQENLELRRLLTDIVEGRRSINWQETCERWGLTFRATDIRRVADQPLSMEEGDIAHPVTREASRSPSAT